MDRRFGTPAVHPDQCTTGCQAAIHLGREQQHVLQDEHVDNAIGQREPRGIGAQQWRRPVHGVGEHHGRQIGGQIAVEPPDQGPGRYAGSGAQFDDRPTLHPTPIQGVE